MPGRSSPRVTGLPDRGWLCTAVGVRGQMCKTEEGFVETAWYAALEARPARDVTTLSSMRTGCD
jgi:hypothetical protein